jgi:hypothetical protein
MMESIFRTPTQESASRCWFRVEALKSFSDGNLSSFELVQKSILRENGVKVTLTSYDPIGDR